MSSKCKNCGGALQYDIPTAKVKCVQCESLFEPNEYGDGTGAEESITKVFEETNIESSSDCYEVMTFTCPSCGATISSSELSAVDYCVYCGSFVSLESQISSIRKPEYIIPFSKTSEECRMLYQKNIRKNLYAPKEFRDESFLEGFKGIYIPFWSYEYQFGPNIYLRGKKETRKGDYIHIQNYDIHCDATGKIDNLAFDASSTFDDEISAQIAPFAITNRKKFRSSYMFGFFGDTADVSEEVYRNDADQIASSGIWNAVKDDSQLRKGHVEDAEPKSVQRDFHISGKPVLTMLPVWFLTWRKDDRVAYSIVNGDTGKIYSEVPIDIKKYLLFSFILALPVFAILNAAVTFSASNMLMISLVLSLIMIVMYSMQLDRIVKRTLHSDDKGYLYKHPEEKKQNEKIANSIFHKIFELISDLIQSLGKFWFAVIIVAIFVSAGATALMGIYAILLFVPIYTLYRIYKNSRILQSNSVWIDCGGALFAIVVGILILLADPAPDKIYYYTAILCMIGVGFTAIRLMKRHNNLITRPVPHFFDRKAGE